MPLTHIQVPVFRSLVNFTIQIRNDGYLHVKEASEVIHGIHGENTIEAIHGCQVENTLEAIHGCPGENTIEGTQGDPVENTIEGSRGGHGEINLLKRGVVVPCTGCLKLFEVTEGF
jgi:hypothetical protein